MSKEKIEYEAVTVKVPKRFMDFLRAITDNAEAFLESQIIDSTINSIVDDPAAYRDLINQKFNLPAILEA